jgi:hypothetical protein
MFDRKKDEFIFYNAFPSYLKDEILNINNKITFYADYNSAGDFNIKMGSEELQIPYRIYYKEPVKEAEEQLTIIQKDILDCLYTRHHNGFIRETRLRKIILSKHEWVVPFILQLLGEYVIEILYVIEEHMNQLDGDSFGNFINNNRDYYFITKQRVMSYWACYYRGTFPNINDYVGYKIVKHFDKFLSKEQKDAISG